jgi:transcriptional regulator GlxA family with amidase domain
LLATAIEAGFGSYAQFYRVFREHYGQSPREYLSGDTATEPLAQLPQAG